MIHFLTTEKTARIVIEGSDNPELKNIWLITHGYGHLATYFIRKFSSLKNNQNLLIVPEALHRFYLNGVADKVGASWMTKEEREKEIEDNNKYMSRVYEQYISPVNKNICINVFGFSQGAAVACRWAVASKHKIDNLIVWGSNVPPELTIENIESRKNDFHWHYVAGDKDEFISPEKQKEQVKKLSELGIQASTIFYEGYHDINDSALNLLTQKCVKKL